MSEKLIDPKQDRTAERARLEQIRKELIDEMGQEAYNNSGIKKTHDEWEGKLDAEDLNDTE